VSINIKITKFNILFLNYIKDSFLFEILLMKLPFFLYKICKRKKFCFSKLSWWVLTLFHNNNNNIHEILFLVSFNGALEVFKSQSS